ncbi:MAG: 23S rRNA (pseudouridine(1915)-N(3))-methyltransferase RlmH [Akkermansiaceae bacterium]|nr:23S rRNA (pseudouridine(1915)-N(3))-methyltransferase RlmH [Akkermansiaceae bacterium]
MKRRVYAIGKPKLEYAAKGIAEYAARLAKRTDFALEFLKAGRGESSRLLAGSSDSYRIVLDERGRLLTTAELVAALKALEDRGDVKTASFLVGGADGHTGDLRESADMVWALSPLTLQHELALVVLLEQLYRADTVARGEPYHR